MFIRLNFKLMEEGRDKQKQYNFKTWYVPVLFLALMLFSTNGAAQYFPAPTPVSPSLEKPLLLKLKRSASANQKMKILLCLSNLYYNKPIKKAGDLDVALNMATRARDLSTNMHDTADFNDAEYLVGNILMLKNDLTAAENILKDVN